MSNWEIHGREVATCNCIQACPCQFNALPDKGWCEAAVIYEIERGRHGDTTLDGLRTASVYKWPGAVHEGDGTMQIFIDENADDAQAAALERIMLGEDTAEMATMWFVFAAMSPNRLKTRRAKIDVEIDVEERLARGSVAGAFELTAEPIRNPVTGLPHRVRIDLPHGFEYRLAEIGISTTKVTNGMKVDGIDGTYAQFADLHLTQDGVIAA